MARPFSRRIAAGSLLLASAALLLVLFAPLPDFLLRPLVKLSSPILLDRDPAQRSIYRAAKDLMRVYLEVSLAGTLASRVAENGGGEEEILGRMMATVRSLVINPGDTSKIAVDPRHWPPLLSGVGWCDQTNGIVARMAAHVFPKAELFALYDADGNMSPHTVGRVWSPTRNTWIYFDAFYATPVIYTRGAAGRIDFASVFSGESEPTRDDVPSSIYLMSGWKMADFPSTFGGYLWARLTRRDLTAVPPAQPSPEKSKGTSSLSKETEIVELATPPIDLGAVSESNREAPLFRGATGEFQIVVKSYADARIKHLFSQPSREAYEDVARHRSVAARDSRLEMITRTARRFADLQH
jgi:hypothetical protein